ncbi:MAG: hypothetical protein EA402_02175 [Planctomycetota bacterium]|nr:MAG: hypothetical protein EA402_02175 [Planctomycetota bacterium]
MDPSGLATEVGTAVAEDTARSIVSPREVRSLMEVDRSINRLDQAIASDQNMQGADLQALRQHVEESKHLAAERSMEQGQFDGQSGRGPQMTMPKRRQPPTRRLGDPGFDHGHVRWQTYQRLPPPEMASARNSALRRLPPSLRFTGVREHDMVLRPTPIGNPTQQVQAVYGLDIATGKMHRHSH